MSVLDSLGLRQVDEFQQSMFWPVLRAMQVGLRVDVEKRKEVGIQLEEALQVREDFLKDILGHPLNPQSNVQMHQLFYVDLRQPVQLNRKTKRPTLNDEALITLAQREPLLRPLTNSISDYRTLKVLKSTFIDTPLDYDGRVRSSFNICGTDTFRLSSSENAFGSGGNLQNIPSDKSKMMGKAAAREKAGGIPMHLPNIRTIYIPDIGYTFFDLDLERADLQVVAWEANDSALKALMRIGADTHLYAAYILDGKNPPPIEELVEGHPQYPEHRARMKLKREFAKVFAHGTNYGGSARTMAVNCGLSVQASEHGQAVWFGAHPGLKQWHIRIMKELKNGATVRNRFGYQRHFFDRPDSVLGEALAWVPQSTVGVVINKAWRNIYTNLPFATSGVGGVLLQGHDALGGQFPSSQSALVDDIRAQSLIPIPYDDPLTIPVSIKTSTISWGDCDSAVLH